MRKIKVPVEYDKKQAWTYLTTGTFVDSAIVNCVDDESFEYSLNNFLEQSDSPLSAKSKFKEEATKLWHNKRWKATETSSQKYIN